MDITTLENWLWEAACSVRGPLDAPKYKDYILPLLFYKRLSDVYEDELDRLNKEFGDETLARQLAQEDQVLIRFYIPNGYMWSGVRKSPVCLGERLTEAMRAIARENPRLVGVIDVVDFNATAADQCILDDDVLARLMEILNRQRLGLRDAVILLPENLFYNTSAPGIILVVCKGGPGGCPRPHPSEILLINGSTLCAKGRPKNYLAEEHIEQICELYRDWRAEEGLSAVITTEEAARNDYNLSPSRYVASNDVEPPLPLEEALVLLAQAEEARAEADAELDGVLRGLGFEGWRAG